MQWPSKHLITGDELSGEEIKAFITFTDFVKKNKSHYYDALKHKTVALLFDKPSLRTRFSFTVAVNELGGTTIESLEATRKSETPEDLTRVLGGYCDAIMVRTFDNAIVESMGKVSGIPIINGLTDKFHPCQTLADLMTLWDIFNTFDLQITYIGDGNNVLHSLLLMATKLGIKIHYCCPPGCEPDSSVLQMLEGNQTMQYVKSFDSPEEAVKNSHAVYTDVWMSMGDESKDLSLFKNFQVNEGLMKSARKDAVFMHCMPMNRGQEVSMTLPDQPYSVIFKQSENRLHVQKALLLQLIGVNHG